MYDYKPKQFFTLRTDCPVAVSKPTSYRFLFQPNGWMIATLNEETGEFQITSDWGNFSFRWDTNGLGEKNLTHFIANAGVGYIANKFSYENHRLKDQVDCEETLKVLRKDICQRRRTLEVDGPDARDLWDRADEWADADFNIEARPHEFEDIDIVYGPSYQYLTLTQLLLPTLQKYLKEFVIQAEKE